MSFHSERLGEFAGVVRSDAAYIAHFSLSGSGGAANDERMLKSKGGEAGARWKLKPCAGDKAAGARPRRIIVCADDFGMNAAVSEGILRLAAKRRITAVSCLSSTLSFHKDARRLRGLDVDIGVHLNLTDERFSARPGRGLPGLLARSYLRSLNLVQVSGQIERQLDAFEATLGQRPHFVDGHQHVHQLPQIRDVLIDVLSRRYGDNLPWLRNSRPGLLEGLPFTARAKAQAVGGLGAHRTAKNAQAAGISTNRALLGVYDFRGGLDAYVRLMLQWLSNAEDGDLIACHPAFPAAAGQDFDHQRSAEFAVLNDIGFAASVDRKGLVLTRRP
ncbi:ChbG/HpnK family deacetylase [Bordetella sp. N]|uniref:ChbG/HpnK family deacetylase n=1 Tax=Bordetella sp. N TaxID=1746199 RepID=UPI0007109A55|nr:ChbG/HpnK family deacetylase [Bordetella sp. N]ALM82357.1 hypothetical protein ASB57_04720 [Bordetella sp. N]